MQTVGSKFNFWNLFICVLGSKKYKMVARKMSGHLLAGLKPQNIVFFLSSPNDKQYLLDIKIYF